jgi:hypothetical protein
MSYPDLKYCSKLTIILGRGTAQAVIRRPPIAEARVRVGSVRVGFVVDKATVGQVFLRVLRFSSVAIIPSWLPILICHLGMNN